MKFVTLPHLESLRIHSSVVDVTITGHLGCALLHGAYTQVCDF